MDFIAYPKTPRLFRECVITEKIDGTNAQIVITEDGEFLTGSRNRWVTPEDDNHGFSRWAHANKEELISHLGVGRHFGEWWGQGIQRGYDLKEKRFSLFNTGRWNDDNKPPCCHVVPVLYSGLFDTLTAIQVIQLLEHNGSSATLGFMKPEGICVYHIAANKVFKVLIENDDQPKGAK